MGVSFEKWSGFFYHLQRAWIEPQSSRVNENKIKNETLMKSCTKRGFLFIVLNVA
jgi:hypothetical protein